MLAATHLFNVNNQAQKLTEKSTVISATLFMQMSITRHPDSSPILSTRVETPD